MHSLRNVLKDAENRQVAVGHFNASNIEMIWGEFEAAKELNLPVVIGFSEGERDFVGVKQAVAIIKSIREEYNYPIFINADHTYSFERVKEVVDAGFDGVVFDAAKLPMEENIKATRECVEYAHSVNPEIIVEAEVGYIGGSSKLWDETPEGASVGKETLTTPADAERFVRETGIDSFAPAVGNLHGMSKHGKNPELHIPTIIAIREAVGVPLVLHGGSGISDENFSEAIKAGISHIHISTEIRIAYKKAIEKTMMQNPDELAPYKSMKPVHEAVKQVALERLKLFNSLVD